jgi:phospholipase C
MPPPLNLSQIDHFIVLMMENRSFDHLFGYQFAPAQGGLSGGESNLADPTNPASNRVSVGPANSYTMPFDPGHEFPDVQHQLYGPDGAVGLPPMCGFLYSALNPPVGTAPPSAADAARVLQCFQPAQVPALSTLAGQFAVANAWYSSLPGPTWPNRFFVHAATSGGLTNSPTDGEVLTGYSFDGGTIYDKLDAAKIPWRIYHDGLPQTAGIQSLRSQYVDPFTQNFSEMSNFAGDLASGRLPNYVFIEPDYDTGNNYVGGNSMHPLNDVRKGDGLIKTVYEALRNSPYWSNTMLIITFDEHGGFFDHCVPPTTVPTGDDYRYADPPTRGFGFNRYGVRVPNVIISAFTPAGLLLDGLSNPNLVFDHSSVLATAELRFGLPSLTNRDENANTLIAALSLSDARTDAPTALPGPPPDIAGAPTPVPAAALATSPLSGNQQSFLALATACRMSMAKDPSTHPAIWAAHQAVKNQQQAAAYISALENQVTERRQ